MRSLPQGNHNMLMIGSPGSGKSMLAERIMGILPPMTNQEFLTHNMIRSVAGLNDDISFERPFRNPHNTCTTVAMIGGGSQAKPGEVALAHGGVLFLDELPEFNRNTLEALRQPLESGNVTISRANYNVSYPTKFMFIVAMNPCRCGYLYEAGKTCSKAPKCGEDYLKKISGPILDRIDISVIVPRINILELDYEQPEEESSIIAQRVINARKIQIERYKEYEHINTNSDLNGELLNKFVNIDAKLRSFLNEAISKFSISMRGYSKILKLIRTVADLQAEEAISKLHVSEALTYFKGRQ